MMMTIAILAALAAEGDDMIHQTDPRASFIRDTDTVFSMTPFADINAWESQAARLRRTMALSCGLWPMPTNRPVPAATITASQEHDGYIIENVYIEAFPGFYVTGNLYRPIGSGPYPGVACPHGHWDHGRLEDSERGSVPARCVTFARMGMVSFAYDMVGYNDSLQFKPWGHNFVNAPESQRKAMMLWGIHPFALQLLASIRVMDYLESLPYVDKNNLACTGASGGGTQTFALYAVDNRVKTAAPVNMISHTMQGGCGCENAPLIRMMASNMEIGALMAPRPLLMVSATGDWTAKTLEIEAPAIQSIYSLYGHPERLEAVRFDYPHNFNKDSRTAVYRFFGKWVLNKEAEYAQFEEPPYTLPSVESMRVFPNDTLPANALSADDVVAALRKEETRRWREALPASPEALPAFQREWRETLRDVLGVTNVALDETHLSKTGQTEGSFPVSQFAINGAAGQPSLPLWLARPSGDIRGICLVIHSDGPAVLADANRTPCPFVISLMEAGYAVATTDVFETASGAQREYGQFPETFLPTNAGYSIQDILRALACLSSRRDELGLPNAPVTLMGIGPKAGLWTAFASAAAPDDYAPAMTIADLAERDWNDDTTWIESFPVPCIRALGGLTTAALLISPRGLLLVNADKPGVDMEALAPMDAAKNINISPRPLDADDIIKALNGGKI